MQGKIFLYNSSTFSLFALIFGMFSLIFSPFFLSSRFRIWQEAPNSSPRSPWCHLPSVSVVVFLPIITIGGKKIPAEVLGRSLWPPTSFLLGFIDILGNEFVLQKLSTTYESLVARSQIVRGNYCLTSLTSRLEMSSRAQVQLSQPWLAASLEDSRTPPVTLLRDEFL